MSNTHKRYQLNQDQVQAVLDKEFKGSAKIDRVLDNGDILINQGGSFRKMKSDDVSKLVQRHVHIQEYAKENIANQVRGVINSDEIVRDGYDASISAENPFHGKNANRPKAQTFGSPTAVLSNQNDSLPSQRNPQEHGLPSSRSSEVQAKAKVQMTGAGGLPSAQRK